MATMNKSILSAYLEHPSSFRKISISDGDIKWVKGVRDCGYAHVTSAFMSQYFCTSKAIASARLGRLYKLGYLDRRAKTSATKVEYEYSYSLPPYCGGNS